jgi:predicted transcriptional regulator
LTRVPSFEDVLGPLEAAVVRVLAERQEAGVGEVVEALRRAQRKDHAYTTVMTVMWRLYEKGVLTRARRGRQYIYRLAAPEAELVDRLSGQAVDRVLERYGTAALRHFAVRLADLDPATRTRLTTLAARREEDDG